MINNLRWAPWAALAAIAVATLSPIGLRPHVPGASADLERMAAFVVVGLLFGSMYSRRLGFALVVVVGGAMLLEILQNVIPTRHGLVHDGALKAIAGAAGVMITSLSARQIRARNSDR
ncbi:hypothetical protein SLNSH_01610 [Alsobacter soli]|uniref:VanZ family protein n=1 Tax=Alsobacter soli TaxID=2109933 RepID=A0A2T1HXX1_9HYPH|nr:hypothetical protein [Alsobacter soli]PSC06536.1 hypothetical protein SLNSH_01610 [Alsobacter soli]